jgi:hypothetical protein
MPQVEQPAPGAQLKDPAQRAERRQQMQQRHTQRHAAHLEQLKTELRLTAEQEAAWSAFVARTEPTPRAKTAMDWSAMTTPQRLDALQAQQAEHSAQMNRRIDATRSFYAQLSPEQQKTFDAQRHGFHRAGLKGQHRHGGQGHHAQRGHGPLL